MSEQGFRGDVSVEETWAGLERDPNAQILDVRTRPEWNFVGLPDLGALGRQCHLVSWQAWPDMAVDPEFVERVRALGIPPEAPLYVLCRSGQRSRAAAETLAAAGYQATYNIADGFEGPKDAEGHRGSVGGWKAAGLPWIQG